MYSISPKQEFIFGNFTMFLKSQAYCEDDFYD